MKILIQVQTTELVEVEIELPYYCQHEDEAIKVESEKRAISVLGRSYYTSITVTSAKICAYSIGKGKQITAEEFEAALASALQNITTPVKQLEAAVSITTSYVDEHKELFVEQAYFPRLK
jgi:hypothetical protein